MPTEREYQQWQRRNRNYRQRKQRKNSIVSCLWVLIAILSIFITVKNNPQILRQLEQQINSPQFNNLLEVVRFRVNSLKSLSQQFVTEIDEAIIIGDDSKIWEDDFSHIDKRARKIIYHGNSVEELAPMLSQYAHTDLEKARIIYSWITHNISYDVAALSDLFNNDIYPDVSTHAVLTNRTTICSGYAHLYQQLAEEMGLKSLIILGYAKGINYAVGEDNQVNHAWNGVEINGKWYLVDATWGAGIISNNQFKLKFNPHYFATNPKQFIYSHFPENNRWQLLSQPYTRAEFDALVTVSNTLFEHDIELVSHKNRNISSDGNLNLTLKAPDNVVAIATLQSQDQTLPNNYIFVQKKNDQIKIKASFPTKGNYQLDIFAKPKDNNNNYPLIASYQVKASQGGNQFPTIFQHFNEHNGYLESPLNQILSPNQNTYFKIKVDNATEVKVVNKSTNRWTDLIRYGNLYAGNVNVGKGKVIVFAKFRGDSRYWALLEYN